VASSNEGVSVSRYLDLMELALTGALYNDPPCDPWTHQVKTADGKLVTVEQGVYDANRRKHGIDWPSTAPSMIGFLRMHQLRRAIETVIDDSVRGDLLETGVWRGGACIMMKAVLASNVSSRRVFVADSFQGMPPSTQPDDKDHTKYNRELSVSLDEVVTNFVRYGLLDDKVVFVPGWFKNTLPTLPTEELAILRLDGDLYESTFDALDTCYHKVSKGGFVIVDDYYVLKGCQRAVDGFRRTRGITTPLIDIDGVGAYWRVE
jgi:O-methyltransferase